MFDNSKQKALKELLEVLSKGIDLLANENLDKDLYEAFEKYADSTTKMVNEAYNSNYLMYLAEECGYIPHNYLNPINMNNYLNPQINPLDVYTRNTYVSVMNAHNNISTEYREKLKNLLQRLISLAKMVIYE